MDALKEESPDAALADIGKAWCDYSGYDDYPPGGGPAAEQWIAFKAGFVASKEKIEGEKLTFLKRQLIEATAQLDGIKEQYDIRAAELADLHTKDSVRTKEHNILVQEIHAMNAVSARLREEKDAEKERRIYYQTIVYDCCNLLDAALLTHIIAGTKEQPSNALQTSLGAILEEINTFKEHVGAPTFQQACAVLLKTNADNMDELQKAFDQVKALTAGVCKCVGCGKTVMNAWRDDSGHWCLTCMAGRLRDVTNPARDAICDQILTIMETYHEQDAEPSGVGTPGGLEHMGDVWRLFRVWEKMLKEPITNLTS